MQACSAVTGLRAAAPLPARARAQRRVVAEAATENGAAATATLDKKDRKPSPLQRGGTLQGAAAAGKDASDKFKAAAEGASSTSGPVLQMVEGRFSDFRWKGGRWDLSLFKGADGETDWDAVIDVEMARRKMLEDSPIPCTNEDPVLFDTAEIPWWAWVRRFHLPEAEKLNGRAAMMGYVLALFVDQLTGVGLLDQQESFIGKVLLHVCVFGILLVRTTTDLDKYKNLIDEATFYDKQWNATWEGQERPSDN
ncbi:low molecular mass early light-induced [Micractinium conductrix]|uniref:Low molecular mass early light-induced n=1 Tax=Micractinium conductrix TaxID=554055 RepID=A0A2P6VKP0_9CHLO|nr:low molecular mass early light-induced [Micractinium conductrix]|eukprot:PSC74627.1 low molecular mass early light-induced [Micractinium conductrix]